MTTASLIWLLAQTPGAAAETPADGQAAAPSPWITTHTDLAFGPSGATLRRHRESSDRQLVVPSDDGAQIIPMKTSGAYGERYPCTTATQFGEELFYADVDGDGQSELFIAWTSATGVGHDGAMEQVEVCGWSWSGSQLRFLDALSGELTRLGLTDAESVSDFLAQRSPDDAWHPAPVTQMEQPDPRVRLTTVGDTELRLRQTGAYFVRVEVVGPSPTQPKELVGMTPMDLDDAGQRTWDFTESWELRTIDGEPDCCAFDLSPAAVGAPHIDRAWTHKGSTYAVLRQEQSKIVPACQVIQVAGGAIATWSTDCQGFLALRAGDPR